MTSSLDTLLAALRSTLADPPQIVLEAERELEAMRDENTRLGQILLERITSMLVPGEEPTPSLMERAEQIALSYHYSSISYYNGEHAARCHELPSLSRSDSSRDGAILGIQRYAIDRVADMLRNGEVPPKPGGHRG